MVFQLRNPAADPTERDAKALRGLREAEVVCNGREEREVIIDHYSIFGIIYSSYAIEINKTGGPEVLAGVTRDVPQPGVGEIVIRNHAGAVNFIDTIIRRGEMPEGMMPELPHVPGVEGAGIIEALGNGVDGFAVGDRVAWMGPIGAGGYGTHSVIASHYVTKIGDLDFDLAASVPVNAMTAYHMLVNLGGAAAGKSVLVHAAAGGVGTMIQHIAKHLGMTVIVSVSSDKMDYAGAQGADHVIDYRLEDVTARVLEITNGKGVDLTLNPISGETPKSDLEALAPLGTAVRQGVLRSQITALPISEAAEAHRCLEAGETTGKLVLSID